MKKCIVIGGGFAGLSAAAFLSKYKYKVKLLEASPKSGGRAYSMPAKDGKTIIDNGQHILMGCYSDTIKMLKMVDAQDNFIYQKNLEINFLQSGGKKIKLKATSVPYPFNLLFGIMNYSAISFYDRLKVIKFFLTLLVLSRNKITDSTVSDLLNSGNQNETINKALWDVIAIGALNTNTKKASADTFITILKQIFFNGNFSSTIILPKRGLSDSYISSTAKFIRSNNGSIHNSCTVTGSEIENNRISKIFTNADVITEFDSVICAVPFYAFGKIVDSSVLLKQPLLEYSSILTVHVWLNEINLKDDFYGLIDSPLHWIFNKGTHLTLVISDADYLMEKSKEEIYNLIKNELYKFAGINESEIITYQILKEKRATFIPSVSANNSRPPVKTKLDNLFVAGDWIDTGLPSTIESAVKSGRMAAEAVLNL